MSSEAGSNSSGLTEDSAPQNKGTKCRSRRRWSQSEFSRISWAGLRQRSISNVDGFGQRVWRSGSLSKVAARSFGR